MRRVAAGLAATLAGILTGCTPVHPGTPAGPSSPRTAPRAVLTSGSRRAVAAQYLLIAEAGNRRLEIDFDGLEEHDHGDLAAAEAALRDAAATERLFDRRLYALTLPPALELVARGLVSVNEERASLTMKAAASTSLRQLHGYEPQLEAANEPVERAVRIIRRQLGLPPPETS